MERSSAADRRDAMVQQFDRLHQEVQPAVEPGRNGLHALYGKWRNYATVAFLNAGHLSAESEFVRLANMVAVTMHHYGAERQAASHGAHVFEGRVVIGTNMFPNADGVGGVWTSRVDGEDYLKGNLPAGVAHPEGILKDVEGLTGPYGLWSEECKYVQKNRVLEAQINRVLDMLAARGSVDSTSKLRAPIFWCLPSEDGSLRPRWRDFDNDEQDRALTAIDGITARRTTDGSWALNTLADEQLTAGCRAEVVAARQDTVTLQPVDGGSQIERRAPSQAIRRHIGTLVGMDVEDMPVTSVVTVGRIVGPNTPLFGPVKPSLTSMMSLRRDVAGLEGPAAQLASRHLTLMRMYALAAEAVAIPDIAKTALPVALVVPRTRHDVVAQLSGPGWDSRLQRIEMKSGSLAGRPEDVGQVIDLLNTGQRSRARYLIKEKRRERKRLSRIRRKKDAKA